MIIKQSNSQHDLIPSHSPARRSFIIAGVAIPFISMVSGLPCMASGVTAGSSGELVLLKNGSRFNGLVTDKVLSMQHLGDGYRMYNPNLMRFQSMDSLAPFNEGGVHSYGYVNNDPINKIDPSGHMGILAIISIVAGIAAITFGVLTAVSKVVSSNNIAYANSLVPQDSTWGFDWTEYDNSVQSAKDWNTAGNIFGILAAVAGVVSAVTGGITHFKKPKKNQTSNRLSAGEIYDGGLQNGEMPVTGNSYSGNRLTRSHSFFDGGQNNGILSRSGSLRSCPF